MGPEAQRRASNWIVLQTRAETAEATSRQQGEEIERLTEKYNDCVQDNMHSRAEAYRDKQRAETAEAVGDAQLKELIYRMDPAVIEDAFTRLSRQNIELVATVSQQAAEIERLTAIVDIHQ